jgi:transposase
MLQRTFTTSYTNALKQELEVQEGRAKYFQDEFEYNHDNVKYLANIRQPEGLLDSMMNASSEFEAAVILYEAYPTLTPLIATYESFWAYLTHVDLYPYCTRRWPVDNETSKKEILDHYFVNGNSRILRNALASIWWSVHFSIDRERENPYELTEVLFKNYSFRVIWFAVFLRLREGVIGVLEFLKEHSYLFESGFENKGRYLANYLNRLGASKNLSALNREYFKEVCKSILPTLEGIVSRNDLKVALGESVLESDSDEEDE